MIEDKLLIATKPKYTVIENVALNFAAEWYEIGRGQGMTSKHKTPQSYAKANFQKFIPKAIEHLTTMLGNENLSKDLKDEIYFAIMERVNNPRMTMGFDGKMPDVDISKLMDTKPLPPVIINTKAFKPHLPTLDNSKLPKDKLNGKV